MRKHAFRLLCPLLSAVVGMMAVMAVNAQAENLTDGGKAGLFLVNKEGALAKAGVTFVANQVGKGTLSVPGRKLAILCEVGTISGEFKSDTEALGSAEFSKCSPWENVVSGEHKVKYPCTVKEPIKFAKLRVLPKKHEGAPYLLFEEDGEALTTIVLEGAECFLPKNNVLTGSISAQLDNNDTLEPTILESEAIQKLMGGKVLFGTFEGFFKSEWKLKLTDAAHVGKTVGVSSTAEEGTTLTDGGKAGLFLVNKEGALAKAGVTFIANQVGKGTLSVPGRKLAILCEVGTISGEFKSDTEALGSAEFSKCSPWENVVSGEHKVKYPCTVKEPIKFAKLRVLPKKHEGAPYLLFEEDGEALTTIVLEGAECFLPKNNVLTGSISAQLDNNDTLEPTILESEAIQKLMGGKVLFGTFEGFFKSEWKLKLTDAAHVGKTVGVC